MDEQLTAIIIKGKVHRLTVIPDDEPCLCKECSLEELCDRLDEHLLCDFIGDCGEHHIFKRDPDAVACVSGKDIGKAMAAYVRRKQSKA